MGSDLPTATEMEDFSNVMPETVTLVLVVKSPTLTMTSVSPGASPVTMTTLLLPPDFRESTLLLMVLPSELAVPPLTVQRSVSSAVEGTREPTNCWVSPTLSRVTGSAGSIRTPVTLWAVTVTATVSKALSFCFDLTVMMTGLPASVLR